RDADAKGWRARIHELRGPTPLVEAESSDEMEPPGPHEDELILGPRSTLLDVAFLARGGAIAPAVLRLSVAWARDMAHGTGLLIAERCVLTNHHVLFRRGAQVADRAQAWFNYELDATGARATVDHYDCDMSTLRGDRAHDWAVVDLIKRPSERYPPLPLC